MSKVTNDIHRFPAWGPYSKKYMGISHLPKSARPGVRFDFTTVPALQNLDIRLPNVTLPTGWHPWESTGDYSQFSYRVDLEWKDRVYADVSYTRMDDHSILVRTELVNHSDLNQNLMINHFASIEYPQRLYAEAYASAYADTYVEPALPEGAVFIDAYDYADFAYATSRPWDRQNQDGHKLGEVVDDRFTEGHGLGDRAERWQIPQAHYYAFGAEKGDHVSYSFTLEQPVEDAKLVIRYRSSKIVYHEGETMDGAVSFAAAEEDAVFTLGEKTIVFPVSDDLVLQEVRLEDLAAGSHTLEFVSEGKGGVEFDFLAIVPATHTVEIRESKPAYVPTITEASLPDGALVSLTYPDVNSTYYLRTFRTDTRFRHIETGSLEDAMSSRLSNPDPTFDDVLNPFTRSFARKHSDDGFFHDTLVHTIFLYPGETRCEYAVLSNRPISYLEVADYETIYQNHRPQPEVFTTAGEPFSFSTNLLKAAVLTNIVFPIRKDNTFILHHTPGKRWDSLYTWDSGFIGLGMLDHNPDFADYILETYTYAPGNKDAAFLLHGSPVPVQMALFYEILQRTNDKQALLDKFYPRLKYYYEFLIGRGSGSTTDPYASGLTTTYDYWYSTSGMDDYPAQVHMIADGLQHNAAPCISSSHAIRSAKILLAAAKALRISEDLQMYENDIARLSDALQHYAWDADAGYFSYVLHDDEGHPITIYRTSDGENLNKGLDGIYPLIAGICTKDQEQAILKHLTSPDEMLCPYGISAVDQSAGYFMVNGYWNGNVWFPHQWFIWKTMLDLGETDFAHQIAMLALEVWKREVGATYYTFEMVSVVTGRGGWFHNFGGLSTPIGLWANAYFKPGTINVGFDTWIENFTWNQDLTELTLTYENTIGHEKSAMLVVMAEEQTYVVRMDGSPVQATVRYPGMLEIPTGSTGAGSHTLEIRPR